MTSSKQNEGWERFKGMLPRQFCHVVNTFHHRVTIRALYELNLIWRFDFRLGQIFHYCHSYLKKYYLLQKWSKVTQKWSSCLNLKSLSHSVIDIILSFVNKDVFTLPQVNFFAVWNFKVKYIAVASSSLSLWTINKLLWNGVTRKCNLLLANNCWALLKQLSM